MNLYEYGHLDLQVRSLTKYVKFGADGHCMFKLV